MWFVFLLFKFIELYWYVNCCWCSLVGVSMVDFSIVL